MNTAKVYYNSEGEERTIWQMIREEPQWAANRIQEGEKAIEELKKFQDDLAHTWCKRCGDEVTEPLCEICVEYERLSIDKRNAILNKKP